MISFKLPISANPAAGELLRYAADNRCTTVGWQHFCTQLYGPDWVRTKLVPGKRETAVGSI